MQLTKIVSSLVLCTALSACFNNEQTSLVNLSERLPAVVTEPNLQTEVEQFRSSNALPAIAVVVVDQDKVETAVSGKRRVGEQDPVQVSDGFQWGSNTKAMTATLIARLVEQHRLRWDSTLAEIFPTWRNQIEPDYLQVSVAQLLQHRSGLIRDFPDLEDSDLQEVMSLLTGDVHADRMAAGLWFLNRPPQWTPNTSFHYSNIGYLILGLIAETVGGDSYENLMAAEVFSPLQIHGRFGLPEDSGVNSVAGHNWGASGWVVATVPLLLSDEGIGLSQFHQWLDMVAAAGGAVLPVSDYGLFLREQLRGLEGQSNYLSQASMQLLHSPANSNDSYGFGWVIKDARGQGLGMVSLHDGSIGTYNSIAILIPQYHRAVAVTCNCEAPEVEPKLIALAEKLARIPHLQ